MLSNISLIENEIEIAENLYQKKILPGPGQYKCGCIKFNIYKDTNSKISLCSFRCANNKCRMKYQIRINSFYSQFPMIPLRIVSEVISCFISKEINTEKAYSYIKNEFNYTISKKKIYEIYTAIRNTMYKYMKFEYRTTLLAEENENGFFSVDESLITHKNNRQIWPLGIINNSTKEFRIEGIYERTTDAIKNFITLNAKSGNNIITDGLTSYNFLDRIDSGYTHIKFVHGGGDFGFGRESTSHIESIWSQIKAKIKDTYYTIP